MLHRKFIMTNFNIYPAAYISAHSVSWQAFLLCSDAQLHSFTDETILSLPLDYIRECTSMISQPYARANHKYMGSSFNLKNSSVYIEYFDANKLYWTKLMDLLSVGDLQMDTQSYIDYIKEMTPDAIIDKHYHEFNNWMTEGYSIVVWLLHDKQHLINLMEKCGHPFIWNIEEIPETLHELCKDYPMTMKNTVASPTKLGKVTIDQAAIEEVELGRTHKLVPTLESNLWYSSCLLHVTTWNQIHKSTPHYVMEDRKSCKFIWTNYQIYWSLQRKVHKNIKETLIKLISNALFGKTLENVGKRIDIKLVTNEKALTKLTSQWSYKSLKSVWSTFE